MRTPTKVLAALLGAVLATSGCDDVGREAPLAPESTSSRSLAAQQSDALAELTRAIALALKDAGLRQRVKNDMRQAPYSEHKLFLEKYLRGNSGGILLAKMAKETGRSRDELMGLLQGLGPMEFYMPVVAHRQSWTGGANLQVAGMGEASTTLVGFDLAGSRVILSPVEPPATPTLVIVPQETDYRRALNPAKSRNVNDGGGQAIGTLLSVDEGDCINRYCLPEPCDECWTTAPPPPPPPPSPGPVQQRGISVEEFITHMRAINDHESWPSGDPEFYLLLAGTHSNGVAYTARVNIPEGPWSGPNDDDNRQWHDFGPISLITWDVDLGSRIRVQCMEEDANWNATIGVGGSTSFPDNGGNTLTFSASFQVASEDDDCGASYIDIRNSLGAWYWIPNGVDDDLINPAPPYLNGTSDLHWYGYGIQR